MRAPTTGRKHLWRHPVGSANPSGPLVQLGLQNPRDTEVADLQSPLLMDEDIGGCVIVSSVLRREQFG